jgi:hypothetical protein
MNRYFEIVSPRNLSVFWYEDTLRGMPLFEWMMEQSGEYPPEFKPILERDRAEREAKRAEAGR